MPIHNASSSSSPGVRQPPTPSKSLVVSIVFKKGVNFALLFEICALVAGTIVSWEEDELAMLLRRGRWRFGDDRVGEDVGRVGNCIGDALDGLGSIQAPTSAIVSCT
jgi:hypothetical protein